MSSSDHIQISQKKFEMEGKNKNLSPHTPIYASGSFIYL